MTENDGKKPPDKIKKQGWDQLRERGGKPSGPPKPWSEDMGRAAEEFVGFLQNAESKKLVQEFIIETYKKFEAEKISRIQARVENERAVDRQGATPFHQPGNISSAMDEDFNMAEVEQAFVRSLNSTQKNLTRSIEDRAEEVSRLLADIGGFNAQLKSSFARSAVVFLEQEDPKYPFRECLIFSVNLPNYELKQIWKEEGSSSRNDVRDEYGRTALQATWDDAVNALAKIVEASGLKPKYCKNDRHFRRFVLKQDLRSRVNMPDEYFSFTLDYSTQEKIQDMIVAYDKIIEDYDAKIKKFADKIKSYPENSRSSSHEEVRKKHLRLCQEREFFIGTTPDPHQLDEGLLFQIEVLTLKEYHVVKDKMQSIMTRYILHLSKIAAHEAAQEKLNEKMPKTAQPVDLEGIPEYVVDSHSLKSVKKKKPLGPPAFKGVNQARNQNLSQAQGSPLKKRKVA